MTWSEPKEMVKVKVGIIGVTGYAGQELYRILCRHPGVQITAVTSESYQGRTLGEVYPSLGRHAPMVCGDLDAAAVADACDVVFAALPHGMALEIAPVVLGRGKKLIDFGADFRLRDPGVYEEWYKHAHSAQDLLREAVYGLPEVYRESIRGARLVANPGCYPTASILGALPLLKNRLVRTGSLIIDAKSGVSGAGRGVSLGVHFSEVNENFKAYNIGGVHRHTPEIEQELSLAAGAPFRVSFTPHLVPMIRGILATVYGDLKAPLALDEAVGMYREFYRNEPFVEICPPGVLPETKQVAASNYCRIGLSVDCRTNRVLVVSVIDNLGKGAAGQAIQNLNLIAGLPETAALDHPAVYP